VDDADLQKGLSAAGRNINGGNKSGISPIRYSPRAQLPAPAPICTAAIKEAVMRRWPGRAVLVLIVLLGAIAEDEPACALQASIPIVLQRAPAQKPAAPVPVASFARETVRARPVPVAAPLPASPKPAPAVPAEPTRPVDGPCGSSPCAHPVTHTCPAGTVAILRDAITCGPAPPVTICPPGTRAVLRDLVTCETPVNPLRSKHASGL
jgi:hypothetical protein